MLGALLLLPALAYFLLEQPRKRVESAKLVESHA
jgi:hypothetical protein